MTSIRFLELRFTGILEEAKAWPESENVEYRQNGKVITIDDLDMYVVGEGNTNGEYYLYGAQY